MRRARPGLLLAALGLASLGLAAPAWAGGGWIPARGASYVELSLTALSTGRTYDAAGAEIPFRRVSDFERPTTFRDRGLHAYGEFGLGAGWGLDAALAWKRVEVDEPATRFASTGPADLRVAVRRGLRAGNPGGARARGVSVPLGYDAADYPSLGSGEVDAAGHLHGGLGFPAGWAEAEVGFRRRGGRAADEVPFAAQLGVRFASLWTTALSVRGHARTNPRATAGGGANFDPARESSSVLLAGPSVARGMGDGLTLSLQALRTLEGRNMPAGWQWKLALARSR